MRRYVEPRPARHSITVVDGVEQLRIPMRRQWLVLALLPVWLAIWTVGGVQAVRQIAEGSDAFLSVWLLFWAIAWLFVCATLAMQVAGAETLRVVNGDLEISNGVGPLRRSWRYRGAAVKDLQPQVPVSVFGGTTRGLERPFFLRPTSGAVRFSYGAETVHCATAVDEPEGRIIAEWLARRLPRSRPPGA